MTLSFEQRQVPQYLLSAAVGAVVMCLVMLPGVINTDSVGATSRAVAETTQSQSFEDLLRGFYSTPRTNVVEKSKRFTAVLNAAKTPDHAQVLSSLAFGYANESAPDLLPYARLAHAKVHQLAPNDPYLLGNFHGAFLRYCTYQAGAR